MKCEYYIDRKNVTFFSLCFYSCKCPQYDSTSYMLAFPNILLHILFWITQQKCSGQFSSIHFLNRSGVKFRKFSS